MYLKCFPGIIQMEKGKSSAYSPLSQSISLRVPWFASCVCRMGVSQLSANCPHIQILSHVHLYAINILQIYILHCTICPVDFFARTWRTFCFNDAYFSALLMYACMVIYFTMQAFSRVTRQSLFFWNDHHCKHVTALSLNVCFHPPKAEAIRVSFFKWAKILLLIYHVFSILVFLH